MSSARLLFDFKRGALRRPENENKNVTAARKERAKAGRGGAESEGMFPPGWEAASGPMRGEPASTSGSSPTPKSSVRKGDGATERKRREDMDMGWDG